VLEIKNASKVFGEGETRILALDNISLAVDKGSFVSIIGPSGSGKSTLLNVIGGLDYLTSGQVILDGKRIDNMNENSLVDIRRGRIAYVFQQYHLIPSLTALENVMLPLLFSGVPVNTDKALDILKRVGLRKRAEHRPGQLSGGEQQRVAIARALVNNPMLVLADEPTGNMDQHTGCDILNLFEELNRDGLAIIMVTHNPAIAERSMKIISLCDGRIAN